MVVKDGGFETAAKIINPGGGSGSTQSRVPPNSRLWSKRPGQTVLLSTIGKIIEIIIVSVKYFVHELSSRRRVSAEQPGAGGLRAVCSLDC